MNQPIFIIAVVLAGVFYLGGQHIASDPMRNADRTITVQATGIAKSVPNIAHVTLGVQVQPQQTAAQATDMLAQKSNAVIAALKALGIADADLKTQHVSVQPSYTYEDGKQTLRGYEGSEQVDVTVRKTEQAGDVIARAAEAGANQVGGVTFKSEDLEAQQLAAEKDAIANAKKKAEEITRALNVRLGKVKQYNVQQNVPGPLPYALESKAVASDRVESPQILPGTQENSVSVTVTYEIR